MKIVKISKLFKNIALEVIAYLFPPKKFGRKQKYTNERYLDEIFYVLKEGIGWNYIKGIDIIGDTLRKVFKKWSDKNVFRITWSILLDIYSEYKLNFEDLFVDTSHIKNYMGSELTGPNHYDRFRKGTKLSVITDDMGIPISIHLDKSNIHDIKLIENNIEKIKIDINSTKFIIADKGYASNSLKSKLYKKYKMQLITPRKKPKNIKGKIRGRKPKYEYKLKTRYIVEHTFSWFKHYTRLVRRKDKKIHMFESFIFMGASNIISNKIQHIINVH